jgi:hypothetical protein
MNDQQHSLVIAIGFLVAYDYDMLRVSLPRVYNEATKIVLAVDRQRLTYTGKAFSIDPSFYQWLQSFDTQSKVEWLEGDFFNPNLTPMQNEIAERNVLLARMQPADWYIQLDVDEYFVDFAGFVHYLRNLQATGPTTVSVQWKTIYKQDSRGYYIITGHTERVGVATNRPLNLAARHHPENVEIAAPYNMVHHSWGRTEAQVRQKIFNWSHAGDFEPEKFLRRWRSCNRLTWRLYKNFHPIHPWIWTYLQYVPATSQDLLLDKLSSFLEKEANHTLADLANRVSNRIQRLWH